MSYSLRRLERPIPKSGSPATNDATRRIHHDPYSISEATAANAQWRRFLYTLDFMMPKRAGAVHVELARPKGGKKSAIGSSPQQGIASGLSTSRTVSRSCAPLHTADAAARNRVVLGRSSTSGRSPGASACGAQPTAQPLDLAAWGPQERPAFHVPHATRAVPRSRTFAGPWILPRVRSTGLSLRLAH